ncbi:protein DEHYDRATION-INDUCED 19 homolog 4-like isoform X1 [Primulina tabacum]|uniref:protein DEHYDRATION-INDUCED 19 homolog 4-like isoform X1 n=1 Tax=Primulina tabacum TaxID=48773 RepID=UPI003F593303
MGDRLFGGSSYSNRCAVDLIDDYNEGGEETEGEYEDEEVNYIDNGDKSEELACPFCVEDFDLLGLCCHIDADHRFEVTPGICPFCATRVGINMASHVITQHESILKSLCNKKNCSSRSRSTILLFRKELQERHLRSIKESSLVDSSSKAAADFMLLSFVKNPQPAYRPRTIESASSTEVSSSRQSSSVDSLERIQPALSTEGRKEMARSEFVQELVLSSIFYDL